MNSYARIESGFVVERLDAPELPPFHPSLVWSECSPDVLVGWLHDGAEYAAPVVPAVDLEGFERVWRDAELSSVMWLRERHRDQLEIAVDTTIPAEQFMELLVYMQALRDWPQSPDFPVIEQRPAAPPWIAGQAQ